MARSKPAPRRWGILTVFTAFIGVLMAVFSVTGSAQAAPEVAAASTSVTAATSAAASAQVTFDRAVPASVATPASAAYLPIPDQLSGDKFFGSSICVGSTLNQTYYPTAAIAQQWNSITNRDGIYIRLDASTNCAADNYYARQSMVIGVFNNPDRGCLYFTNTDDFPFGDGSSMNYWQKGPVGIYINVGIPSCISTAFRRSHQIAAGIGFALGFDYPGGSGVMCICNTDVYRSPTLQEGYQTEYLYTSRYGG